MKLQMAFFLNLLEVIQFNKFCSLFPLDSGMKGLCPCCRQHWSFSFSYSEYSGLPKKCPRVRQVWKQFFPEFKINLQGFSHQTILAAVKSMCVELLTGRKLLTTTFGENLSQARTFFERLYPAWKRLIPLQSLHGDPQRVPSAINKEKLATESWNYQPEIQRGKWQGRKELY